MAKVNFRAQKRQKEMARKQRQDERLARRTVRPAEEEEVVVAAPAGETPEPVSNPS
jgi:hypothetical protein